MNMNFLKEKLKEKGITQKDLAEKLGISTNAVNKWFMGLSQPTLKRYIQILDILGITTPDNFGLSSDGTKIISIGAVRKNDNSGNFIGSQTTQSGNINTTHNGVINSNNYYKEVIEEAKKLDTNFKKIPVINYVQAGEFTDHPENVEPLRYEIAAISQNLPENAFALEVKGSSMKFDHSPNQLLDDKFLKYSINAGELVVIDTSQIEENRLFGKIIVAMNGDGTTVKLVYEDEKGLCLMPLNSKYQTRDEIKRPGEVRILGRVVKVITPSRDF